MPEVVFVDTGVLCEILAVPGKSQRPDEIRAEVRARVERGQRLVLPAATIIETGNHIAQLPNGHDRRERAAALVTVLASVSAPKPPWVLYDATWDGALLTAMCEGARGAPPLPELASQKVGGGDVSILAEAEAYESRVAHVDVSIWTLDAGLRSYA